MERIRDSRWEEDVQVGLLKETVTLRDRAARKERERERLRELLNQGKNKRRRISRDKLVVSPRNGCTVDPANDCLRGGTTSSSHRHGSVPQLKPFGLSPATVICASVPRKPRSVGNRRKGKSWGQIVFNAKVQLPSAPALVEKSSPLLVQNEIEVEIAEVLSGLKKQVCSSDEPLVDVHAENPKSIKVHAENPKSIKVQDCSVNEASKDDSVDMSQVEPLSINTTSEPLNGGLGIDNHDKAVLEQEISTAEEWSLLFSKPTPSHSNLTTSEVASSSMVEAKSKHQKKFVIDWMELPPTELSPEGDRVVRSTTDRQIISKDAEMKPLPEKAMVGCFLKEEVVDEKQMPSHLPHKMVIKAESHDLDQRSPDHTGNKLKQPFQKRQKPYLNTSIASAQISPSLLPLALAGLSSCPHEGTYKESRGRNHGSFASMISPDFRLVQPRPKRCATHHYIAQNIFRHQQALAAKLISPEIPQDLSSYFAKPNNDNDLLSSEGRISGNLPQGLVLGGNLKCVKDRAQGIEFYSQTTQQENKLRTASTVKDTHKHASHRTGHMMAGPFIFPLSQNQTMMANQSGLSLSASSTGSMRFSHPNGAPFLAVLPGNVCTNPSSNGEKMQSSGGKNTRPMPFLDGQLHPSRIFFPVQIHQQGNLPFTTRGISSADDIRASSRQRNVTCQSLFSRHSSNIASMPSAGFVGGQWQYAENHNSKSGEKCDSTSSFSFASSIPSHPTKTNAGGPSLNFSLAQNSVVAESFLDNTNLGSQILQTGNGLQHRNSEIIQNINGGESMRPDGERKLAMEKFSSFMGAMFFDNSVTTPNYELSLAMQNPLSARIHLNNSIPVGASQNKPTPVLLQNQQQQMLQTMAASQLKLVPSVNKQHPPSMAAKVSDDLSIFSGNFFDRRRSSLSLQQRTSDIKQASEAFPISATPPCNSTLHNPHQQKLAIPNSHIRM